MDSQGEASGLHQGKETYCVPFSRMAGVSPGQVLVGMQRTYRMALGSGDSFAAGRRLLRHRPRESAVATCSGYSGIEFPSQKGATAAGWPRRRGGAGGSRAGLRHGLSGMFHRLREDLFLKQYFPFLN